MNYPKVSIIILNWDGLEDTIECLESLKKITYTNYEVILVDNGSEGNEAQVLREKFGDYVHTVENDRNYGFAKGSNIGMNYAFKNLNPHYILVLDNDTVVDSKFLSEMVKVATSDEKIGICGAKMLKMNAPGIIDSTGHVFSWGRIIDRGRGKVDKGQYDDKTNVIGAMTAACLYKKDMLKEIGLFDESFIHFYADAELSWRAYQNGWKARFVPSSIVYHKRRSTRRRSRDVTTEVELSYIRNTVATVKRYGTQTQKFLFTLVLIKAGLFGGIKLYIESLQQLYHKQI